MAQPKTKPMFKLIQKKPAKQDSAKAYLRNLGKGELKFAENTLKFYTIKGRFRKQKDLAKLICLPDIQNVTLQSNELDITLKDATVNFVIKNKAFAELIYAKAKSRLEQLEELREPAAKSITADAPENEEPESTLTPALSLVDSLFDALICLHGRVDWKKLGYHVKRFEEDLEKISERKLFEGTNLDYSLLFSAVTDRNVELISLEGYRLLETFYGSYQRDEPEFLRARNTVNTYYVLNDIILACIVGDTNMEDELVLLNASLAELSKVTGMKTDGIVESLTQLIKEQCTEPHTEEARITFKRQLSIAVV